MSEIQNWVFRKRLVFEGYLEAKVSVLEISYSQPVACRGSEKAGDTPPPPLNSGCQIFPKGPPFGIVIVLRHPLFANQPQNLSKGAFGAK